MPESPASKTYLLSPGCGAGDAGDNAEDSAEAVVDAVDRVTDPCAGLLAAFVALGQHLVENGLGIHLRRPSRRRVVTT